MWTLIFGTDMPGMIHQSPHPEMGNATGRSRGESEGDAATLCGIRLADARYWAGLVTDERGHPIVRQPQPVCSTCQKMIAETKPTEE